MRKAAWLGLLAVFTLGGCDVIVVTAVLLSQNDDSGDDGPAVMTVTVQATDDAAAEPSDPGTFTITRNIVAGSLTVFFTVGGTATPGSDYSAISPLSVTLADGQGTIAVAVTPLDDFDFEADETVVLTITQDPNYSIGFPGAGTVTIVSDDALPTVTVTAPDGNASEVGPDTGTIRFTRDIVTAGTLTVNFTVGGSATSGADYTSIGTQAVIPANQASVDVTVTPINDSEREANETVVVTLSAGPAYSIGSPSSDFVTLASEDDERYHVWVANLDAAQAAAQKSALISASGNPDTAVWKEVGTGTATAVFTPPAGMNTVLIQMYDTVVYHLDAVEILNVSDTVLEVATAPTYSDKMSDPADDLPDMLGAPDGLTVDSAATPTARAFAFSRYASTLTKFRVNIWGAARAAGDVEWVRNHTRGGNQTAGGAAVNAAGTLYASFRNDSDRNVFVLTVPTNGTSDSATAVETTTNNAVGSHAVAIDPANSLVYVAATGSSATSIGDIRVRKYDFAMALQSPSPVYEVQGSLTSAARVEANGITVDGSGNVVLVGGAFVALENINHWIWKFTSSGANVSGFPVSRAGDTADRWWHGVAIDGSNRIFTVGDETDALLAQPGILVRRTNDDGAFAWEQTLGAPPALGAAVGIDGSGNVYAAGFDDGGAQGREGLIVKYTNGGTLVSPFPVSHTGPGGGDDEILDIAVEPDGTFYAVGYETVTGLGENWWIRKYTSGGAADWTRTHHHRAYTTAGNDRAVSVSVSGSHIVVTGHVTLDTGETEIHVRKYVK